MSPTIKTQQIQSLKNEKRTLFYLCLLIICLFVPVSFAFSSTKEDYHIRIGKNNQVIVSKKTIGKKNAVRDISGKLIGTTQDFIQGDSVYLTIEINGGEPPFAFRYFYETSKDEVTQTIYQNIIDIPERNYTFALLISGLYAQ